MKKNSFSSCRLTSNSLKEIKDIISSKDINVNPAWFLITGKSWYEKNPSDPLHVKKAIQSCIIHPREEVNENLFFFTQAENSKTSIDLALSTEDLIKCSIESLEHSNGRLNFKNFEDFSDEELSKVFEALKDGLSENGVFNLCQSVCNMTNEQSLKFLPALCKKFLLPQITELDHDSVLTRKGICDCAYKFPNELRDLVLTGMLNSNPKSTYIIIALLRIFESQKHSFFLSEFVKRTRELKEWHFSILNMFPSVRLGGNSKQKLLKLYVKKANTFSYNKEYAKLIYSFAKINAPFTEEERIILVEIATLNQTIYKKLLQKYCTT